MFRIENNQADDDNIAELSETEPELSQGCQMMQNYCKMHPTHVLKIAKIAIEIDM